MLLCLQRDSVRNQREHLILLLANVHIRLSPKPEPLHKACTCFLLTCTKLDLLNNLEKEYGDWKKIEDASGMFASDFGMRKSG